MIIYLLLSETHAGSNGEDKMDDRLPYNEIIDVCLLAGKIMLQNGAETSRVEDTMVRIAAAFGCGESHSFQPLQELFFAGWHAPSFKIDPGFPTIYRFT